MFNSAVSKLFVPVLQFECVRIILLGCVFNTYIKCYKIDADRLTVNIGVPGLNLALALLNVPCIKFSLGTANKIHIDAHNSEIPGLLNLSHIS